MKILFFCHQIYIKLQSPLVTPKSGGLSEDQWPAKPKIDVVKIDMLRHTWLNHWTMAYETIGVRCRPSDFGMTIVRQSQSAL